ncbi:MAG: 6-phosphogluconolactonase [Propionibacteriales bacterium]|nr:6-phosphogluconolactonase [Propionibacteriales bacterium]
MPDTSSPAARILPHTDADALAAAVAAALAERVARVQAEGRTPHVVLTGGTIAIAIYERLAADAADWADVVFWFGDERFVPEGHEDRNDRQARDSFLERLGVPAAHVRPMPAHGCSTSMAEAADGYGASLPEEPFDVVLLGVGPDGHVASLFPGFAQVHEQDRRCVEVFDSPKPPPERISLTFPALNHTRATWFLVSGDGKADAVARALAPDGSVEQTPARGAHGLEETVWFLDQDAASRL